MKRTQIYLDDEQTARLDARAAKAGTTRSAMIRDAIDDLLGPGGSDWAADWQRAVQATAGIAPALPADHVETMRTADAGRLAELARRGGA